MKTSYYSSQTWRVSFRLLAAKDQVDGTPATPTPTPTTTTAAAAPTDNVTSSESVAVAPSTTPTPSTALDEGAAAGADSAAAQPAVSSAADGVQDPQVPVSTAGEAKDSATAQETRTTPTPILSEENLDNFPDAETWTSLPPEEEEVPSPAVSVSPSPATFPSSSAVDGSSAPCTNPSGEETQTVAAAAEVTATSTPRVHPLSLPFPPVMEPSDDTMDSPPSVASPLDEAVTADSVGGASETDNSVVQGLHSSSVTNVVRSDGAPSPVKDSSLLGGGSGASLMGSFLGTSVANDLSALGEAEMSRSARSPQLTVERDVEEELEVRVWLVGLWRWEFGWLGCGGESLVGWVVEVRVWLVGLWRWEFGWLGCGGESLVGCVVEVRVWLVGFWCCRSYCGLFSFHFCGLFFYHFILYVYIYIYIYIFFSLSLLLSWIFEHDCLDTCCLGCLMFMCFVFLYLHLFSTTEHVSHGKALCKYNHY